MAKQLQEKTQKLVRHSRYRYRVWKSKPRSLRMLLLAVVLGQLFLAAVYFFWPKSTPKLINSQFWMSGSESNLENTQSHQLPKPDALLPKQQRIFQQTVQHIAHYATPGLGVDPHAYQPFDHVRISKQTGLLTTKGYYTAPSKNSPYLAFMLNMALGQGIYEHIVLTPTDQERKVFKLKSWDLSTKKLATYRMWRNLSAVRKFQKQEEALAQQGKGLYTGLLPWTAISKRGKLIADKDLVPILDNALMSWSLAGIVAEFAESGDDLARELALLAMSILKNQRYELFWDAERGRLFGEINRMTGQGNSFYHIGSMWTEDLLVLLWVLLNAYLPEAEQDRAWRELDADIILYHTRTEEYLDVPLGYVGSNHELAWSMLYLPWKSTPLWDLIVNSQVAQADFALREQLPGFQAVAYDALGAYTKMGVPGTAAKSQYIQRTDTAAVYATCLPVASLKGDVAPWATHLLSHPDLQTPYGPLESIGPEGSSDVFTADSQFCVAAALGGGIVPSVQKYLRGQNARGKIMQDYFDELMQSKFERILADKPGSEIYVSDIGFPQPVEQTYQSRPLKKGLQHHSFDVISHMTINPDDRHGSYVHSVRDFNHRWEIYQDFVIAGYKIPVDADEDRRFAWLGTYMDQDRVYPIGFSHVDLTFKNTDQPQKFNIEFKREDTSLVQKIVVDTTDPGSLSADQVWKTMSFPLSHRGAYVGLPLTYTAISIDDPRLNEGYRYQGDLVIKSLYLRNRRKRAVDIDKAIAEYQWPANAQFNLQLPQLDLGDALSYVDSGALGMANDGDSQEQQGLLYAEWENVPLEDGFSGVWSKLDPVDLSQYQALSFDVKPGGILGFPGILKVEFKQEKQRNQSLESWFVRMPASAQSAQAIQRIVLPLNNRSDQTIADTLSFAHENWVSGLATGSFLISNVRLHKVPASRLFSEASQEVPVYRHGSLVIDNVLYLAFLPARYQGLVEARDGEVHFDAKGAEHGGIDVFVYPEQPFDSSKLTLKVSVRKRSAGPGHVKLELKDQGKLLFERQVFIPEGQDRQELEVHLSHGVLGQNLNHIRLSQVQGELTLESLSLS